MRRCCEHRREKARACTQRHSLSNKLSLYSIDIIDDLVIQREKERERESIKIDPINETSMIWFRWMVWGEISVVHLYKHMISQIFLSDVWGLRPHCHGSEQIWLSQQAWQVPHVSVITTTLCMSLKKKTQQLRAQFQHIGVISLFSYCLDSQASLKSLAKSLRRDRFAFKGESFLGSLHPPPTMPSFHLPRDVSWTSHLVLALLHNYLPNSPSSKPSGN